MNISYYQQLIARIRKRFHKKTFKNTDVFSSLQFVRLGDLDLASNEDEAMVQQFGIAEIFIHPVYSKQSKYNDIMLIKIDGEVQFNEIIRPACLADASRSFENRGLVSYFQN